MRNQHAKKLLEGKSLTSRPFEDKKKPRPSKQEILAENDNV